ncbi:zinc finger protein CO3-like isoform X1 [Syzygium oleosum]|uniref:zinc finger protein CO3-like isoform X1 n=1 Tax=Syzygium oleosum TaxID=219896 RepID=UPI0024BB010A|nr:zinc finger protein CO3-like isoform X1 [Syzygium oleosum]
MDTAKTCALCKVPARTFCESDQAALCWDCDAKVHGANFLVARHSRTLLCHACQAPTPWKASGARLGHTVSVCDSCVTGARGGGAGGGGNDDDLHDEDEDEDDDADEEEDEDEDEDGGEGGGGGEEEGGGGDRDEDGDNQVVPWSSTTPPPPAASSSSSEESISNLRCGYGDAEECGAGRMCSSKRTIDDRTDLRSQVRDREHPRGFLSLLSSTPRSSSARPLGRLTGGQCWRRGRGPGTARPPRLTRGGRRKTGGSGETGPYKVQPV